LVRSERHFQQLPFPAGKNVISGCCLGKKRNLFLSAAQFSKLFLICLAMDQVDEKISEEVRKYDHLYNSSMKNYKDSKWLAILGLQFISPTNTQTHSHTP